MSIASLNQYPQRIVCLTEETTETLYLLGEGHRVVGISGYTVRPREARQKPKVSSFLKANYDKILALEPELVFTFSDLQAELAADLIRHGVTVCAFNQRTVAEIFQMILTVGRLIGCESKARALLQALQNQLQAIALSAASFPHRPRVWFEEWPEPLIAGIGWCEELAALAGGVPLFPELRGAKAAKERVVEAAAIAARDPEVVLASWCGRPVKKEVIRGRVGWEAVSAIRSGNIYEVKSTYILQPGPAALTEGVQQVHLLLARSVGVTPPHALWPQEKFDQTQPAATIGQPC